MSSAFARAGIVIIGLFSLAAFTPGIRRWYRYRRNPIVRHIDRFSVQHLSHLVLLVHHSLVALMLLSIRPFSFLPGADARLWLGRSSSAMVIAGLALFALGNGVRIWAAYYLGDSFDKAVLIKAGHRLRTDGPYRLARHPIYVGNLVAELGLGLGLASWPLVAYTLLFSVPVWNYRAMAEERLLAEHFGRAYRDYCEKVRRWWP